MEALIQQYVSAVCCEIEFISRSCARRIPVCTVFLGGGTPSILPSRELEKIITSIQREFILIDGVEITLEANPGRLSLAYLKSIREMGLNRISLGMQSANPEDLSLLDRQHDYQQLAGAVNLARQAGFENISLDLIFGIPNQSLTSWQRTLDLGISLHPEHLSLYALSIEPGTPMGNWVNSGLLSEPDPDLAADMYDHAVDELDARGFKQYEISNWAKHDISGKFLTCQHNLQYWRNLPYLGLGAGGHGFAGGVRTQNELNPVEYIRKFSPQSTAKKIHHDTFPQTPATLKVIPINKEREMRETMMMGLRLTEEGVSKQAFQSRFGDEMQKVFENEIEGLLKLGLLEWEPLTGEVLRLTSRGRLLGNQVFMQFI
jgi:oxygen-independent coproporphyrinogen-3 oxidase